MVEYRLPQITIGAKEQWQPYLGDLFIIIWVRYYAHTHKHKTHARACALNTKTNKIKRVKDVKVKKNNEKPDELWCENILQFLVAFKKN